MVVSQVPYEKNSPHFCKTVSTKADKSSDGSQNRTQKLSTVFKHNDFAFRPSPKNTSFPNYQKTTHAPSTLETDSTSSFSTTQGQIAKEAPAQMGAHPYVVTEREVRNEEEEVGNIDGRIPIQDCIRTIVYPGLGSREPFTTAAWDYMRSEIRKRQVPHDGTVRPDQTYIDHPPTHTPKAQTESPVTLRESTVTHDSRRFKVLECLERCRAQLESANHSSAPPAATIAAAHEVSVQDSRTPTLSSQHAPLPQLRWLWRKAQEEHEEEEEWREQRQEGELRSRTSSAGSSSSVAQEPEPTTAAHELDVGPSRVVRQAGLRIRGRDRGSTSGSGVLADGNVDAEQAGGTFRDGRTQIQHRIENSPTESSHTSTSRHQLRASPPSAGTQPSRSPHSTLPSPNRRPRPPPHQRFRFRHLLSHFHSHFHSHSHSHPRTKPPSSSSSPSSSFSSSTSSTTTAGTVDSALLPPSYHRYVGTSSNSSTAELVGAGVGERVGKGEVEGVEVGHEGENADNEGFEGVFVVPDGGGGGDGDGGGGGDGDGDGDNEEEVEEGA